MHRQDLKYLKVFLYGECNFNCISCHDSFVKEPLPDAEVLATEEMAKLVDGFARLGVEHVRIIGGEPLIREDIFDFIHMISSTGSVKQLSLTTNGFHLKDKALALKGAGLNRINIYLSSLDKAKFKKITGVDGLDRVMEGICAAKDADISPIRINVVLVKELNYDELEDFAALSILYPLDIRFIEYYPGFANPTKLKDASVLGYVAKNKIEFVFGSLIPDKANANEGPATYYRIKDAKGRIGFINPVTEFFCLNCNSAMLYNDGRLFPCLYSSAYINLGQLLRSGEKKALAESIRSCFTAKQEVNKYTKAEEFQPHIS